MKQVHNNGLYNNIDSINVFISLENCYNISLVKQLILVLLYIKKYFVGNLCWNFKNQCHLQYGSTKSINFRVFTNSQ